MGEGTTTEGKNMDGERAPNLIPSGATCLLVEMNRRRKKTTFGVCQLVSLSRCFPPSLVPQSSIAFRSPGFSDNYSGHHQLTFERL
jgi:hypothetical protein